MVARAGHSLLATLPSTLKESVINSPNPPELLWLTATAVMCVLLFAPYVLARIARLGLFRAMANPMPDQDPRQGWAWRADCAHKNAVENLVVFAPLVLIAVQLDLPSSTTATTGAIYFAARLVHYVVYVLGIPVVRTLAYAVGLACQLSLALRIFGVI